MQVLVGDGDQGLKCKRCGEVSNSRSKSLNVDDKNVVPVDLV